MRVLVTGGAGFIGSALCRELVASHGAHVVNVDKLTYAADLRSLAPIANDPRYAFEQADICQRAAIEAILAKYQPDAVLHLAAESHVDRSINDTAACIDTNVVGTYQLLEAARQYHGRLAREQRGRFRFVHVSTDEVYGTLGAKGRFRETSPYQPSSPYSASKAAADHLAQAWYRTYGLPVIISNCSNNYGPYQFPEKLIPLMILNALEGKPLPVYGDGSNVRDWLYVSDHCTAIQRVLASGRIGQTYNIGGGCERRNVEVVRAICAALAALRPRAGSYESQIEFVRDRPGHDRRYAIDASKVQGELGWRPVETFESGLRKTVQWYLQNGDWVAVVS